MYYTDTSNSPNDFSAEFSRNTFAEKVILTCQGVEMYFGSHRKKVLHILHKKVTQIVCEKYSLMSFF